MKKNYKWLFIEHTPLLYESHRVAKQLKIEFWLSTSEILKQLGIKKIETNKRNAYSKTSYIA